MSPKFNRKTAEVPSMSMRQAMMTIAGTPGFGEQAKWLKRIADAANISRTAALAIWRGTIHAPDHRAVVAVKREAERIERERAYAAEKAALAAQYLSIAERLNAQDSNFHERHVAALV